MACVFLEVLLDQIWVLVFKSQAIEASFRISRQGLCSVGVPSSGWSDVLDMCLD